MGQRMPKVPIIYGDDCLTCFPAGKAPKYVYARFSLVKKCVPHVTPVCKTPPNDRVFKLTQDLEAPCHFRYESPDWLVSYHLIWGGPPQTRLYLQDNLFWAYFHSLTPACADEGKVFHNILDCDGLATCSHSGIAVVTWNPQATELLEDINLERATDLFMELRPLEDGKLVYKFCRLQDATNIAILFEP